MHKILLHSLSFQNKVPVHKYLIFYLSMSYGCLFKCFPIALITNNAVITFSGLFSQIYA